MSDNPRKRLFDMEIDEISLVDRGANQHAAIVISKALDPEEEQMPDLELYEAEGVDLYDEDGDPIDDIASGDTVYDEDGNEFVYIEDVSELDDFDMGKSEGYEGVSKLSMGSFKNFKTGWQKGMKNASPGQYGTGGAENLGGHFARNRKRYGGGALITTGVGGTGVAVGAHNRNVEKSLGDVVLEELSKAANEDERSEVIAKAMEEVEIAKAAAAEAWERVAIQEDAQLEQAFISKAAEFNLPVDPIEFGRILKSASTVLSSDQLDLLEQLFTGVGETLYEEVGYVGDTDNASVLDVVNGYVDELVGKADATPEMISTAIFDSNPGAYDAYIAENRW